MGRDGWLRVRDKLWNFGQALQVEIEWRKTMRKMLEHPSLYAVCEPGLRYKAPPTRADLDSVLLNSASALQHLSLTLDRLSALVSCFCVRLICDCFLEKLQKTCWFRKFLWSQVMTWSHFLPPFHSDSACLYAEGPAVVWIVTGCEFSLWT